MKYYARNKGLSSAKADDIIGTPVLCGDTIISTKPQIKFVITYPLEKPVTFTRTRKKWTFQNVVDEVRKIYQKNIYANAAQENKYGVWGHGISDLSIEALDIKSKKKVPTIQPSIGS
jgi:hypothetical protein